MTEAEAVLLRADRDGVAWLTLNRPTARNALSLALMEALTGALETIASEADTKVVVIAGAGPAFCAGHDLRELRSNPGRAFVEETFAACSRLMLAITRLAKPVIARVHGVATAAGCQLAATCDSSRRGRDRAVRDARREYRPVLFDADGGAEPGGWTEDGDGDAADGRSDPGRPRSGDRAGEPGGAGCGVG